MAQPRRVLISSFVLTNGTIITPLLLFSLKLGLFCKKIHRFVQYTPRKCFNNFVQIAVDAGRQGDKNPNSSVFAKTMKLLANSSYGYQIIDRSGHNVTKYLTDEKTHSAINSKLFKRLNHITYQLYEVELVKPEIEHREPIIVGFLFYNMLNRECWNFTTISSKSFVTLTSMKNLKWIPTPFFFSFIRRKFGRCHSSRKTS